jgi:hypothetical protein
MSTKYFLNINPKLKTYLLIREAILVENQLPSKTHKKLEDLIRRLFIEDIFPDIGNKNQLELF